MATRSIKHQVLIIESERGWGQKVDEVKLFDTEDEAWEFVRQYNQKHNNSKVVPDWYMIAEYTGPTVVNN